jgi:hypothetical protein
MHYLRKHSKVILVVMGIVCMITFVVGAALSDLVNSAARRAQNPNPVVVTWAKGKVTTQEMQNLRYRHAKVYEFLQRVIFTAMERGAKPIINGRQVTLDRMQSFDVGIPADNSEESTVQTLVLAAEADRMGVAVDVDTAKNYLRQISSPELKEGDWYDIATQTIGQDNRMSVNQLLEHLAYELKAQHVRMLALSGYYAQGVGPIVPPGQAYELFCRLLGGGLIAFLLVFRFFGRQFLDFVQTLADVLLVGFFDLFFGDLLLGLVQERREIDLQPLERELVRLVKARLVQVRIRVAVFAFVE